MWDFARRDQENYLEFSDKRGEEPLEKCEKREDQEKRDDQIFERSNDFITDCCCHQPVCCDETPPIFCEEVPMFNEPSFCGGTPVILDEVPIIIDEEPIIIEEEPIIIDDICDNMPLICDNTLPISDDTPFICCDEAPIWTEQFCGGFGTEFDIGNIRIKNPVRPCAAPLGWSRLGI
ncbi:2745_t:CDS:1 [Acaulospora colombiana]|uniref:2745_t:CDS:1 n=1 Tax=Acaulospora colombiana TaxID=27376 RepID=A0ACA9KSC6_9GLOM|nr:2745_t:CDS:1 [Acaulospora colombiana]